MTCNHKQREEEEEQEKWCKSMENSVLLLIYAWVPSCQSQNIDHINAVMKAISNWKGAQTYWKFNLIVWQVVFLESRSARKEQKWTEFTISKTTVRQWTKYIVIK